MKLLSNDNRYTATPEWCGHPEQHYVLRFCGEFVDSFRSLPEATLRAVGHRAVLSGTTVYTNQEPT